MALLPPLPWSPSNYMSEKQSVIEKKAPEAREIHKLENWTQSLRWQLHMGHYFTA